MPTGRVAARSAWWGGTFVASTGDSVRIDFADAYGSDPALGNAWAELFAALVHGEELRALRAYVAPPEWVEEICGDGVLGCYGGNELIVPGEPSHGVSPWEIAAHEYGHHVAANRNNAPWNALDWGTKRWASYANVCSRAGSGAVFPGDQGTRYRLNPGEGFAEAYRVLNERRRAIAPLGWQIVDESFMPDDSALALIDEDVRTPWQARPLRVVRLPQARRSWRVQLTTPLDGQLEATLDVRSGASYDLTLSAGTRVVARGLWSSARTQSLQYTVCGQRALTLRIVRKSGPRRFVLRIVTP